MIHSLTLNEDVFFRNIKILKEGTHIINSHFFVFFVLFFRFVFSSSILI